MQYLRFVALVANCSRLLVQHKKGADDYFAKLNCNTLKLDSSLKHYSTGN